MGTVPPLEYFFGVLHLPIAYWLLAIAIWLSVIDWLLIGYWAIGLLDHSSRL
jgi:hypothetical protein